ncbi:hypothetical protein D0Y65_046140 [Glycine soja]|uniref:Uncharacterized protein n=1 Tax=Glycine soja TaxID=3848 RepID=A0A445G810_GLYSO|nr:hypothetical protein D0Y65_046140 [Glycine soja]
MYFVWWRGGGPRLCRCGVPRDCVSMSRILFSLKGKESCDYAHHVGNELGANRSDKAKASSFYALLCAFITTIVATILTVSMTYAYGQMSIEYEAILSLTATTLPIVGRELLGAPSNYVNGQNCPCLKNVIFNCGRTFFRAISRKNFFRRKPRKKVLPQLKITTAEEPSSVS